MKHGVRASLFAAILLTACSPRGGDCIRDFVFEDGRTRSQLGPRLVDSPLGVVGLPLTAKAFAPRTACDFELGQLSARLELLGPDNYEVEEATLSAPQQTDFQRVVSEVSFTPRRPGQHLLNVVFEPSLGVRSMILEVADARMDPFSVQVTVPRWTECIDQAWPASRDAIACERSDGGIEVFFADGGVSSFAGQQLVAAGSVLWSVEPSNNQLHRRLVADGGVVLTDAWDGFSTRTVKSMHDERSALRALSSGELAVARIEDSRLDLGIPWSQLREHEVVLMDDGRFLTETPCLGDGSCLGLRGLEPGMLWTLAPDLSATSGLNRPIPADRGVPDLMILRKSEGLGAPRGGFERLPLWLPMRGTSLSVLVNADRPQLGLSAWTRSEVLRVGKDFVLLSPKEGSELRLTPR